MAISFLLDDTGFDFSEFLNSCRLLSTQLPLNEVYICSFVGLHVYFVQVHLKGLNTLVDIQCHLCGSVAQTNLSLLVIRTDWTHRFRSLCPSHCFSHNSKSVVSSSLIFYRTSSLRFSRGKEPSFLS